MLKLNSADMVTLSRTSPPHWECPGILHAFRPFMGNGYLFILASALFLHYQVGGSWMVTSITVTFTASFPSSSVPKDLKTGNSCQTYSSGGTSRVPFIWCLILFLMLNIYHSKVLWRANRPGIGNASKMSVAMFLLRYGGVDESSTAYVLFL